MEGLFITFEGPDGSGKTTQLRMLAEYLTNKNDLLTTREPGGTIIGNKIREILLDPDNHNFENKTEILLYAASRAQLVHESIIPHLKKGGIVLCDRYIDASIAYQSYGLGMDRSTVEEINRFASSNLQPDRTYLLYLEPELSQKRLIERNGDILDRIEQKDIAYHRRVSEGFKSLAKENPQRILMIEGNQSKEAIFNIITKDVEKLIKHRGRE